MLNKFVDNLVKEENERYENSLITEAANINVKNPLFEGVELTNEFITKLGSANLGSDRVPLEDKQKLILKAMLNEEAGDVTANHSISMKDKDLRALSKETEKLKNANATSAEKTQANMTVKKFLVGVLKSIAVLNEDNPCDKNIWKASMYLYRLVKGEDYKIDKSLTKKENLIAMLKVIKENV